jgi:hypothetical protein
MARRRWKVTSW